MPKDDEDQSPSSEHAIEDAPKKKRVKKKPGKIRKGFSWAFGPFVNVFGWLGYSTIKDITRGMVGTAKIYLVPQEEVDDKESFNEAQQRLKLSEQAMTEKAQDFFRVFLIYAIIAGFIFLYAFFLLFDGYFRSFFLAAVIGCLALANAFRYHFWYFQIKNKKLGCTLKEWREGHIDGGKK